MADQSFAAGRVWLAAGGVSLVGSCEVAVAKNGKISIVLTDDHKVVSHALRSFFESFPDVRVAGIAASGEELLARLGEWLPDVAVVDLLMPGGIDGVETTRRVVQSFPDVRVIALTASTDEARMAAVLRAGASGYIRKDADPELLLKAVRSVAQGRSFIDPSAAGSALVQSVSSKLSTREVEVLREAALGRTNREIGDRLFISEETVKSHVAHVLAKLELQNRTQLVAYAIRHRLVDVEEL
jgi:NarL family two-component system response regulator LiaR